jgi:hypothetical protein
LSHGPPIAADGVLWVPIVREEMTKIYQGQYCRWIKDGIMRTESPLVIVDISRSEHGENYLYVIDISSGHHTGIPVSEAYVIYEREDDDDEKEEIK